MSEASTDIAVVGMSALLPGCPRSSPRRLDDFWRNLCHGVESITFFRAEELDEADAKLAGDPAYVAAAGILDGPELFDAAFFDMSPRQAELLDPQHRIFLECAWEALEDAACNPRRFPGPIGLFAGSSRSLHGLGREASEEYLARISTDKDFLTTRTAYALGLTGPAVTVQTACSTSLVAVHLACQSLLGGECDLALAGGVSLWLPDRRGHLYEEGGIASPDGHCRAFDARAAGTVTGFGVGVVVLRRLGEALAGGDPVRALVRGSAVNNDGAAKVGFTAPGVAGQAAVVAEALAVAGVEPGTVGYVEAHGTGTVLGDSVEVAALTEAFASAPGPTWLGSLKTNLGHLGPAAGVAGLIKTVLALKHRQLPPTLHFEQPHPEIDFGPFRVGSELRPWRRGDKPRRAGVSSFGIGGTNAHVVLEEAPEAQRRPPPEPRRRHQLLVLSARTPTALEEATARLAGHLAEPIDLADVAYTLQVGRRPFEHRRAVVAADAADAAAALGEPRRRQTRRAGEPPEVAFLFPGQGTQGVNMGRGLYDTEPAFRREIDRAAEVLLPHLGLDLRAVLYPAPGGEEAAAARLERTELTQPALFAFEYALARLWICWGVEPRALLGHSVGEYVAACLAGVFRPDDALALLARRGRLIQELAPGAMASVALGETELRERLGTELDVAAVNAGDRTVVSGPEAAVESLAAELAAEGLDVRRLAVSHAFHSRCLDGVRAAFAAAFDGVELGAPRLPFLSNVTGTWIDADAARDPGYWVRQMTSPVRFADAAGRLLERPRRLLLEVGPGRTLTSLVRRHPSAGEAASLLASLPGSGGEESEELLVALGGLWLAGAEVDWEARHAPGSRRRVALPTYPFEHRRYVLDEAPRVVRRRSLAEWFYVPVWRPAPLAAAGRPAGSWLVFATEEPPGPELERRLAELGRVVRVLPGESFERRGEAAWVLDPRDGGSYRRLFQDLHAEGAIPQTFVHMWSVTGDSPAPQGGEEAAVRIAAGLDAGFYSLLELARECGEEPRSILVVSDDMQEVTGAEPLRPEKAPLLGACRVISQEEPHLSFRSVDLSRSEPPWRQRRWAEDLLRELAAGRAEPVIAYRGGRRQAPDLAPVRLGAGGAGRLRRGGVYLITGGLGGVGLAIADFLVETAAARLVLVGRGGRAATPEADRWLAEHRGEVLVGAADVADPAAMERVLGEAEQRFGPLAGVVHAAGVSGAEAFPAARETTRDVAERHFQAKIRGLLVLERLLRGRDLDFCLLTSSTASWLGGLGYAAYAGANLFMDAFARLMSRGAAMPWLSVNWDAWRLGGDAHRGGYGAELAELAMSPAEATEALSRILAADVGTQVAVAAGDLRPRLERWVLSAAQPDAPASPAPVYSRPALETAFAAPRSELECTVAGLWQEVLGLAAVGVDDDFFELGGDSLLAVRVLAELRRRHRLEIALPRFFQASTVAELAAALEEGTPAGAPSGGFEEIRL